MTSVSWCLVAASFALGLVLTLAFMVGRVKREVPVYAVDAKTAVIEVPETDTEAPYGAGSVRLAAGAEPPPGWQIKGNEDSMLYHSAESPDSGKSQRDEL